MKIVMLDRNTIGMDIDVSVFAAFGEFVAYDAAERDLCRKWIHDADIVIFNKTVMDEDMLGDAKKVKLLCVTATGYDNIDLNYAREKSIAVANVRNYSTSAVAQHTFALALYVLEKLSYYDQYVKSGEYSSQLGFSNFSERFTELSGKTWGIIGMGNIGRAVAKIAEAFGCRILHFSPSGQTHSQEYQQVDFDELLRESDLISLHCPLSDKTKNIMNENAFRKMKQSAILINVARGPVVNEEDLANAILNGWIAGAGLDVLSKEPMSESNPLGKISDSRKLIITPHMAWASAEARNRCIQEVYANIEAFLRGEERNRV